MLSKTPKRKSAAKSLFRGVIYFELAAFFGTYYLWKRMNSSQDFRFKVKQNFPSILEGYYTLGERMGSLNTRQVDENAWKTQK